MSISSFFRKDSPVTQVSAQTARPAGGFLSPMSPLPLRSREAALYDALRENLPIVDAAIAKIVRLAVDFKVTAADSRAQALLDSFCAGVPVGASGRGLSRFAAGYLDSLLTYGNAVGEIVLAPDMRDICGLYLPDLSDLDIRAGENPLRAEILVGEYGLRHPLPSPELVSFSALEPKSGGIIGRSILSGLPFLSEILMKIYESVGNNFERVGSLRYAVTYKPSGASDRSAAREIAKQIAEQWSAAVAPASSGELRDFVAVGDVDIKVIGADNQFIDTEVPVRQILEQIIAKLGIPPFILGLSWSTTERMSRQQADIFTSELESYRKLLTPVLSDICALLLRLHGFAPELSVDWGFISLQDETELAQARLSNAKARAVELANAKIQEVNP